MLPHASINDHASAMQRVLYDKQITEMMELNFARKLSEEEIRNHQSPENLETKRKICQILARIIDPLDFVAAFIIQPR